MPKGDDKLDGIVELRPFLDSGPAITYVCLPDIDFTTIFISGNIESKLGYRPEDILSNGQFWSRNVHADDMGRFTLGLDRLNRDGQCTHEYRLRRHDGDYRWIRDDMTLVRDTGGRAVRLVGHWIDVTECKRLVVELDAAKRDVARAGRSGSRLLAAASHDLRQPLQTMSLLQGILARKTTDPEIQKLLVTLEATLGAMSGMLATLLDSSQVEAGNIHPKITDFPIGDLLDRLRNEFSYHAHAQARGLGWRAVPCGLTIRGDANLIELILRNLLSNAMKYTERGKVLLGCRRQGDKVRIEVWDTGVGIPEDQRNAVFEEFHQVGNPAGDRSRGLGLGLALARRVAGLLGHAIDLRSMPGRGSVFAIELPIAVPPVPGVSVPSRRGAVPAAPISVLVVDDDPAVRDSLAAYLRAREYRVSPVATADEALALFHAGPSAFDVLVVDYNLAGALNGINVIQRARASLGRSLPAIILTGDISGEATRVISSFECAHLQKPAAPREIAELIVLLSGSAPRPR